MWYLKIILKRENKLLDKHNINNYIFSVYKVKKKILFLLF